MKHLIWSIIASCMLTTPQVLASTSPVQHEMPDAMQHMVKAPEINFTTLRDPFASYLSRAASRNQVVKTTHSLQSNRKREILENYDLETLRLVAIFSMGGERVAMIEDSASKGYIIRRGNRLGKHNGKIEKITETTIFLVEEILNPAGEVTDRQVSFTLNEVNE